MSGRSVTLPVEDTLRLVLNMMTVSPEMACALASTMAPINFEEVEDAVRGMPNQDPTVFNLQLARKAYYLFKSWGITTPVPQYALSVEAVEQLVNAASSPEAMQRLIADNGFTQDTDRHYRYWRPVGEAEEGGNELLCLRDHPFTD